MESTFATRVLEFRKHKGLSQQAFAERCGLEQGNVTQMERGTEPKQSNVAKVLSGFPDLSPDWLLLGEGPMLRGGRSIEPFLPGGEVNAFGATVLPPGGLAAAGLQLEDAEGYQKPKGPLSTVPRTDKEFIDMLVARISDKQARIDLLTSENEKLHRIISEQQGNVRFLQGQVDKLDRQLAGKLEGNQVEAPGIYATASEETPVAEMATIGFVLSYMRRKRKEPVHRRLDPQMEELAPMRLAA